MRIKIFSPIVIRGNRLSGPAVWDFLIELVYLLPIFLVPIWFAYWLPTYNIFEFNKLSLFKLLTLLLFWLTAVKLLFYPPRLFDSPRRFFARYWLIPVILIVGLALGLLASINPVLSFYGSATRQAGLVSYFFYFWWFILLSFNLITLRRLGETYHHSLKRHLNRLIQVASLSGLVVSIYAILQILDIDFLTWPQPPYLTHRALSTFGQPNFLASWLLLVIPLSFYLAGHSRRAFSRCLFAIVGLLELAALFLTGSRGGLLGLIAAGGGFALYKLFKIAWSRWHKIIVLVSGVAIIGLALIGFNFYSGGRVNRLWHFDAGSAIMRLDFYSAAGQAIEQSPWLGYGLENSSQVFIKYYRPDWGVYGKVAQNTDRAHDLILDILLNGGLWELALFVVFYYFFFKTAAGNIKKKNFRSLSGFIMFGATAYLLSLFVSFSVVATEVYFWSFLAVLVAIKWLGDTDILDESFNQANQSLPTTSNSSLSFTKKVFNITISLALLILTVSFSFLVIRSVLADYYFNIIALSLKAGNYGNFLQVDSQLSQTRPNPVTTRFYNRLIAQKLVEPPLFWSDGPFQQEILVKLRDIDRSLPAQGYNNLVVKGEINTVLGNFSVADSYFKQLVQIAPFWPPTWLASGDLALKQGNLMLAVVDYHLAALNTPNPQDTRLNPEHHNNVAYYQYLIALKIADAYSSVNNLGAAIKYYVLAYQDYPSDLGLLKKISFNYYQLGNLDLAKRYAEHYQIRNPQDNSWPFNLSSINNLK